MDFGGIQDRGGAVSYLHPVTLIIGDSSLDVQVGFSYDIAQLAMGCSASEDSSTSSPWRLTCRTKKSALNHGLDN